MYSWSHEIIESDLFIIFNRMTREQKIEAIYAEMANKEVSFGCRYMHNGYRYTVDDSNYRLKKEWDNYYLYITTFCNCPREIAEQYNDYSNQWVVKIIWHPAMLGDVLDWIEPYWSGHVQSVEFTERRRRKMNLVLLQRDNKRLPIDEQSDGCIDYVYSLIPSKSME